MTTATTRDHGATLAGIGVVASISVAIANPAAMPNPAPITANAADSMRNWLKMSPRVAPRALRMPISAVRSVTDMSMMFMITIPPTTSEMPTNPGNASARNRLILAQNSRNASPVSSTKLLS